MDTLIFISLLIITGMVVNQKFMTEAIHRLLIPQPELIPHKVAVVRPITKR